MSAELSKVLDHIEKIGEIEGLDQAPPTSHVVAIENALREDEPRPSLAREVAVAGGGTRSVGGSDRWKAQISAMVARWRTST